MSDKPICPGCGGAISIGSKFCMHCGAALPVVASNVETMPVPSDRERLLDTAAKSVVRTIGTQVGRDIVRGVLGSILGGGRQNSRADKSLQTKLAESLQETPLERLVADVRAWALTTGATDPQPQVDAEAGTASYNFDLTTEGHDYDCYLDVQASPPAVGLYIYTNVVVPDQASARLGELLATLHRDGEPTFELVGENQKLRCRASSPLETPALPAEYASDLMTQTVLKLNQHLPNILNALQQESTIEPAKENPMRLTSVVQQWLKDQEWEEQPDIDEENGKSSTAFGYRVGDFSLRCWLDVAEEAGFVQLFMYFRDTKAPEKRLEEVERLCTLATKQIIMGGLLLKQENREIFYYHAMDFDNASFEPAHINNMLSAGASNLDIYLPKYMAVCFGGKTAEAALEEEGE